MKESIKVLNEFFDNMKPIIGVKITLTDVYIHEVDYNGMDFKISTHIVMNEVLTGGNPIQIIN
ncbi:hypothetical protein [Acetivibrio cellulolyticus]|uniref:hypothetical protein n=1 Tax=Acetivibrio cellulolyticus TaxID=35830 RepID=UPI0001E2C26D|nr:hypothetical protein [Acetivibrio cellulolyticus]